MLKLLTHSSEGLQFDVELQEACIATLLSLATLYMLARVPRTAKRKTRQIWLAGGAMIAGWGM